MQRLFFPCCSAQRKPSPQEQTHWRQSIIFLHLCLRRLRRLVWLSSVGVLCRLAWACRGMTPHRKVMVFCHFLVDWLLLLQRRYWTWFCDRDSWFQKMKNFQVLKVGCCGYGWNVIKWIERMFSKMKSIHLKWKFL